MSWRSPAADTESQITLKQATMWILSQKIRQFMDVLGIEKVILAGHSMANVELSHFNALYPERVLELIYLDAAYDRNSASYKIGGEQPVEAARGWMLITTPEKDYFAAMKRAYPSFSLIWTEAMEEQSLHEIIKTPEGKIADKMSDTVSKAIMDTLTGYVLEDQR